MLTITLAFYLSQKGDIPSILLSLLSTFLLLLSFIAGCPNTVKFQAYFTISLLSTLLNSSNFSLFFFLFYFIPSLPPSINLSSLLSSFPPPSSPFPPPRLDLQQKMGIYFEAIEVIHCFSAYGFILSHKDWKFVYSGDSRPCEALIAAGLFFFSAKQNGGIFNL